MNKLFWSGAIFQILQLFFFGVVIVSSIDWSFISVKVLVSVVFVILNIASLVFMVIGSLKR